MRLNEWFCVSEWPISAPIMKNQSTPDCCDFTQSGYMQNDSEYMEGEGGRGSTRWAAAEATTAAAADTDTEAGSERAAEEPNVGHLQQMPQARVITVRGEWR